MNKSSNCDTYWDAMQKLYAPSGNQKITMHLCQGISTGVANPQIIVFQIHVEATLPLL